MNSHKYECKSVSGKPLLEIIIDNETPLNIDDIKLGQPLKEPSMDEFSLKVCFDHVMRHFDGDITETFGTRSLLDHARKTRKYFSFINL